jgi:hypothetical protein
MVFCLSLSVTENGRRRRITKLRATLKQLINKAAVGDFCAARVLKIATNEADTDEIIVQIVRFGDTEPQSDR